MTASRPDPRALHHDLAHDTWGADEDKAILAVLKSRRFTMGPKVAEFEAKFAAKFGRQYAVMVNSGSSANLVAVAALIHSGRGLKPGDEVLVPCISWSTTFYPLAQYGLKLRFVDVDLETLNLDVTKLEKAITKKTKALVSVSILGNPCDYTAIRAFCKKHGLLHFEDNCESMGATWKGEPTGTFGLISTFSTFFSHHISTMEGGLALTDDKALYNLMRSLRNHGWTRDQESDSPIFKRRADDFYEAYRFILPGYNLRPGEIHGAAGLAQLKKLDGYLKVRRKNAAHFTGLFAGDPRFVIQTPKPGGESSWFSFTMIVRPELAWDRSRALPLLKKAGIGYRIITGGNFLRHDVIEHIPHSVHSRTNADLAHDRGFFVGNHPTDLRPALDRLHRVLEPLQP